MTGIDQARDRLERAVSDAEADGYNVDDFDVYASIVENVCLDLDTTTANELRRVELGIVDDETATLPAFGSPSAFYLALGSPKISLEILAEARERRNRIRSEYPVAGYGKDYR